MIPKLIVAPVDSSKPALKPVRTTEHWIFCSGNGVACYTQTYPCKSTLLEGFTANGSLGYQSSRGYNRDPSCTSHAHG
ncbi:hypothetical protein IW261DRAFT_1507895 [Armillaria novae-zelandiae]|uniref:Uncharacterized protein n=1 Tax=Armillaria novae-zelandiae TaxID=153914 RepID=A0AA39U1W7_9AGAR|nr:hypothetical protein IW261DRAFT_1507895 [Armillaria novae-zelandiae]